MPQKLRCQVTEILDHGERVYSVFLETEFPAPRFLAGQFIHLALDKYAPGDFWPDSRPFSIASAPSERNRLRITYAVKGIFTSRMEAELHPGLDVWVKMPYGEFIVNTTIDVCLLAGGTGVTAFTAFLSALAPDHPYPVHLFYGARRSDLLIYRPLVEATALRCANIKAHFFSELEAESTGCLTGRIDSGFVIRTIEDPLSCTYYLAGPPEMISDLTSGLGQLGVPAQQIIADAWE
jgi:ferredoxin-NADP reductase